MDFLIEFILEFVFEIGVEEALYDGVCLIEWPERMGGYLPATAFHVEIKAQGEGREVDIICNSQQKQPRLQELKALIDV